MFSLEGRCALVTGASRGIGAAIALGVARSGADVALVARSRPELDLVAQEIRQMGRRAVVVTCDVTRRDEIERACEEALRGLRRIDVLVNNAGGPVFQAHVLEVRDDGWQKILDLNLLSVLRFSQLVGATMVERGAGSIINVASHAHGVVPVWAGYLAAKAAVLSFTRSLAVDWGGHGVRVNAICPGAVDTAVNRHLVGNVGLADVPAELIPLNRWARPEDLVGTAIWLASDASSYVTGAVIDVGGGMFLSFPKEWLAKLDQVVEERPKASGSQPGSGDGASGSFSVDL